MNYIALDEKSCKKLSKGLNELLANYQMFYSNVRGFHWNLKGDKFFEMHVKFEELYNDLFLKIDEIAERIVTLGATPLHTFEDFIHHSKIKAKKNVHDAPTAVQSILESFKSILELQRALLSESGKLEDEGTNSQMSDYIREQEKLAWMYKAYLS